MALVAFLIFGAGVVLFGSGFVYLTLKHHRDVKKAVEKKS